MQLIKFTLAIALVLVSVFTMAQTAEEARARQEQDNLWLKKTALTNVEVNILGSYYSQDGNFSRYRWHRY